MIPVAEAIQRITDAFDPLTAETVSLAEASGRVLAEDVLARTTQPPF
ncbi:MAG: molybdopterin molybdenumtransferase MoeA, partial [Rhodospirillaceae bacterium]|nr:molybdopterin molybdenumtransferase MoeA [Rhodospirillaceae bacterium]